MAFDYAKAYQQFIDEEFAAASATAWMIPEAGKVRFTGGRDIEISTLSTTGLGNYDAGKADGSAYPQGTVTNSWKSYTLSMDRGVKFTLDRTDPNDTGFLVTAENRTPTASTACTSWPTATRPTIPPTSSPPP